MAFGTMSQRRPRFGAVNPLDPETSRSVQSLATAMRGSRPGLPSVRPNMDPGYAPSFAPTQGGGFTRIGIPQSGQGMTLFGQQAPQAMQYASAYGGTPAQPAFGGGRSPAPYIAPNGMRGVNPQQFPTPPAAQQQQDLLNLNRGYEQQSQQLGTYGFRYGQDGRPQMPALTAGEQAMIDRQRSYDASSDQMGAASSYDRFRPGGAFGSPAPAAQYQPTLVPNNTPVGTQTTILNRDDGRQVGLTANFRGDANSYVPIPSGDAAVDTRRSNAARAAQQGTAYFGTRVVPREQNQGAPTGLPGVPRAVARGMSPGDVQGIRQAGVNTRRNAFGLPSVSMGQNQTDASATRGSFSTTSYRDKPLEQRQAALSQSMTAPSVAGAFEDPTAASVADINEALRSQSQNWSVEDRQQFEQFVKDRYEADDVFRDEVTKGKNWQYNDVYRILGLPTVESPGLPDYSQPETRQGWGYTSGALGAPRARQ